MHSVLIQPADAVVNKIEIGYNSSGFLAGFNLYAQNGAIVLQTGFDWVDCGYETHTEYLDEGERLIGWVRPFQPTLPPQAQLSLRVLLNDPSASKAYG